MALDGMKRVLEIHAGWLKDWRKQLKRLESGKISLHSKGPKDNDWVDETKDHIKDLKQRIAMIETIDKLYRA